MTNRTRILFVALLASASLLVSVVMAAGVNVGEVTHRFSGAAECILLDPPAGTEAIKENVRPNDEFTIRQFITNTCDNTITVDIALNAPSAEYIRVDTNDEGIFAVLSGNTISALATVTFGNDTPAEFSAKDVQWKVERPE